MQITKKEFTTDIEDVCDSCGSNKVRLIGTLNYFELFTIPVFSISSSHIQVCSNCKANKIEVRPTNSPIPKFQYINKFIGLFLIPIFIALFFLYEHKQEQLELDILTTPQAFDFYIVNLDKLNLNTKHKYRYSIAKVVAANKDLVRFKIGNYSYQTKRDLIQDIRSSTLLINNYFSNNLHEFQTNNLLSYKANKVIIKAMRPKNLSLYGGLVITPNEING